MGRLVGVENLHQACTLNSLILARFGIANW